MEGMGDLLAVLREQVAVQQRFLQHLNAQPASINLVHEPRSDHGLGVSSTEVVMQDGIFNRLMAKTLDEESQLDPAQATPGKKRRLQEGKKEEAKGLAKS